MRWHQFSLNRAAGFARHSGGAAAVEMALILPFIAGFAIMSASVWDIGMRKQNMNGALKLAAQYYMNGGQDDVAAKSIAMSSWQNKPETTTFNVIRICRCGPSLAVCTGLCADSTPPAVFVHLSATATSASALMAPSQVGVEELRVR